MYNESYSLRDWLKLMESKYVKIEDIISMNPRESKKFLCIDDKFLDLVDMSEKAKKPSDFFKYNYIFDYIHSNDLQGTRIWSCETMSEMIELEDFNFEINYNKKQNIWCTLTDKGKVDNISISNLHNKEYNGYKNLNQNQNQNQSLNKNQTQNITIYKDKDWREFPRETLVGWRGPLLHWEDVINGPLIYYEEDEDIINNGVNSLLKIICCCHQ